MQQLRSANGFIVNSIIICDIGLSGILSIRSWFDSKKPGKQGFSKQYLKEKKGHIDLAARLENSNSDILRKKDY